MKKKFYFIPLESRGEAPTEEAYCRIYTPGMIRFGSKTMQQLGIDEKGALIRLYQDKEKRAIAFKILKETSMEKVSGVRFIKPHKVTAACKTFFCQIGVSTFIKTLDDVILPTPRLIIKEYDDKDAFMSLGKLYYITIPRGKQVEEDE